MTLGRAGRPTALTNSETKVRAFNATANHFLPSWLQQQPAWKQYQCQISLFTAYPGMGGENLSLCASYRATDHPRGRIRRLSYPEIPGTRPYPFIVDPPRPGLDQPPVKQESKACMTQNPESFHRLILYVTTVSEDGRPFSGHVATAVSTALDKTSLLRHLRRPCLLLTL
jgi:hypothetical protein